METFRWLERSLQGRIPGMADSPRTPPMVDSPIRLAVCVSGGGTTLQNLIDRIRAGGLVAELAVVIADRPGIGAIDRAERAGVPCVVVPRAVLERQAFGQAVFAAITAHRSDLVILGGFLSLLPIPNAYHHKVLNIHPALIPAFCGRGFHGAAVHRAALEMGVKVSGCTVHFADDTYDTGPIVLQRVVPVLDDDTPDTLAARVFAAECHALPEAIALYAAGRMSIEGRRVLVSPT